MPPGFTEQERERITERLLDTGRRLFTTQGLRKTTLDELVGPAGIAKSSFYLFFDSKESLYLELLIRQAPEVTAGTTAALASADRARDSLVEFLRRGVETATGNSLYRRLLTHPQELAAVVRRVGPQETERVQPFVLKPLLEFITGAQDRGELVGADPQVLVGVVRATSLAVLHAEEFGDDFPAVLDLLIRAVATGLTSQQLIQEGT